MMPRRLHVLLVEDNVADVEIARQALARAELPW